MFEGKIVGTQGGSLWLIDVGNSKGRVYDMDANMITVPIEMGNITNSGYWDEYPADESQTVLNHLLKTAIEVGVDWKPIKK